MEAGSQRLFQPGKTSVAQQLCPRLIDYIVIVGSRPSTSSSSKRRRIPTQNGVSAAGGGLFGNAPPGGLITHPELLRRYPNENHRDFELPRDVVYFCQPEGAVSYTGNGFHQLRKRHLFNEATSFVFMLTEKDTAKVRYGITLSFFLSLGAKQKEQQQLPNSPTVLTNTTEQQQKQRQHQKHSSGSAHLISLCLLSHHPFLSAFRDLMHLFRHLADCCNYRANLDESLPRDAVWTVLAGHWPHGMSIPMPVMQELRQLETWLFTLLSSPVPVPGNTKLLLEVLPCDMMPTPLEFALPDYTRFSLVDFPLHLPLELLGVEAVMQILAAIMLEYKVILQSRNYNAVSMCVMALVAMLYPLEYMFPVIPLLPAFMPSAEQLLLAPTPFIIGLPASFFHFKGIQIPSDVLLADLDTNQLIMPSDQSVRIPQFPEYEASILREEFLRAMGKHPHTSEGNELLENGANSTIDGDEVDVKCRVAMIHFYSGPNVFANFSEHTRTIRLYPRPVVALQVDSFLRSRGQNNEFISELCKTQAVEYFAECSLCPPNETYVRIQTGVISSAQIGDKAKWFSDSLMPAYPFGSTLSEAIFLSRIDKSEHLLERNNSENLDEDAESEYPTTATSSDLESVGSVETGGAWSPFGSRSPLDLDISKPLSDACDIYQAPNRLELPKSESKVSIDSSDISSCRSSPLSVVDSEADFARLAQNLALKRNAKGDFTFANSGHATDEETVCENSSSILTNDSTTSLPLNESTQSISSSSSTKNNNIKNNRPLAIMNKALNSGQGVFDQMMKKSAPKAAQAAMAKALPLAEAVSNRVMEEGRGLLNRTTANKHNNEHFNDSMSINNEAIEKQRKLRERENAAAAQQQRKSQQQILEICEQVISGQGIGVFSGSKVKRLLEDESLRELICSKLNMGLEVNYAEDEFLQDVQLSRAQYRGYLKLLQACIIGLESNFNLADSQLGLASAFHVLEIAHTHFWTPMPQSQTPSGTGTINSVTDGIKSLLTSPSASSTNLAAMSTPSSGSYCEKITPLQENISPIPNEILNCQEQEQNGQSSSENLKSQENHQIQNSHPPPLPSHPPPPLPHEMDNSTLSTVYTIPPPKFPPPPLPVRAPPLPPRNPPLTQTIESTSSSSLKSKDEDYHHHHPPTQPPPPLPQRPRSATNESTNVRKEMENTKENIKDEKISLSTINLLNNSTHEIKVKDAVNIENKQKENKNFLKEEKQITSIPPTTLNLKTLEDLLPSNNCANNNNTSLSTINDIQPPKHFLYQDLLGSLPTSSNSSAAGANLLWLRMPFWETAFLDMVAQERDKIGMDEEPAEMIDRYSQLSEADRKRLELEEDRILATLLHNMTAMMHLCHVPVRTIQQKVRRMLGKAHIGLIYSKRINQLLDELINLPPTGKIPLKPLVSRLIQKQVFAVHEGSNADAPLCFLEICDDAIILRACNGAIQERWWYERMVNMTYSPKARVLCLWQRHDDQVHMHKFHTKKCRQLYNAMKSAMERAASRGKYQTAGRDLGGEFPIHDVERNEGGLLKVRIDGIQIQFVNSQELIELSNIKKCNTLDRRRGRLIQRRYISTAATTIAWCLHRVFSIHIALVDCPPTPNKKTFDQNALTVYKSPRQENEQRAVLPLRVPSEEEKDLSTAQKGGDKNNNKNTQKHCKTTTNTTSSNVLLPSNRRDKCIATPVALS
uniref:MAP kinase-activating death domain protein n=1 Tax=Meloidogyne hapla TaxID=6305 RepID=A0A1I8BUI1_MELHA